MVWIQKIKILCTYSPSLLALSRQNLPTLISEMSTLPFIRKGGYLLKQAKIPQLTLMATGSEFLYWHCLVKIYLPSLVKYQHCH